MKTWTIRGSVVSVRAGGLILLLFVCVPLFVHAADPDVFRVDLRAFPLYARKGFDPALIVNVPQAGANGWILTSDTIVQVKNLNSPGKTKRHFLDPRKGKTEEFTFLIPFTLPEGTSFTGVPGFYFAGIGDNWEIYLNGSMIGSEMHLDAQGEITVHCNYRGVNFPADPALFKTGENILAFRIAGDPDYSDTGFFYTAPYYLGNYAAIQKTHNEFFTMILFGIYLIMGIYHIFMYLIRRTDLHNLCYGLFSLDLGLYIFSRTAVITMLIPDIAIVHHLEFFCVFIVLPLGAVFLELTAVKRILTVTKIYGSFFLFLAIVQLFFSLTFANDILVIWQFAAVGTLVIVAGADIIYLFMLVGREVKEEYLAKGIHPGLPKLFAKTLLDTPSGNLMIGAVICGGTAFFDILDSAFFHYGLTLSRYGFLVFTVGATLILARRFGFLYSQQQRIILRSNKGMNARLVDWIVVQDKDPEEFPSANTDQAIMFTDIRNFTRISENMSSGELTDFLNALNEILAKPLFEYQDKGEVAYTDKFIGDGTMNIFTNPTTALKTAVRIRSQLLIFNNKPEKYFSAAKPEMRINLGTGIAWGPVTVGVMGHSRRLDYTPIGDTVNLASRLESLTKEYHTPILINDSLYRAIDTAGFNLRHIDRIRVKGKDIPVNIYEEYSSNNPRIRELKKELAPRYQELQDMYFSGRDWKHAVVLARELIDYTAACIRRENLGPDSPGDYLPAIYLERMNFMLSHPEKTENWDGVFTFR